MNGKILLYPSPLVNRSVACWLNSFIQAICSLPQFCAAIKQGIKAGQFGENNKLYNAVHGFIIRSANGFDTSNCTDEILVSLKKLNRNSMFAAKIDQHQQCVCEFFTNLLEALSDENINKLFTHEYIYQRACGACGECSYSKDICIYSTIIKNDPRKVSLTNYPPGINDILLKILGMKCTLSCTCSKCGETRHDTVETQKMVELPTCFVLTFNKAVDNTPVVLEEYMSFRKKSSTKDTRYKLMATICHFGIPESGHYIANCLRLSSDDKNNCLKWYSINDQQIRPLESAPTMSADIFMAFYSMIQ